MDKPAVSLVVMIHESRTALGNEVVNCKCTERTGIPKANEVGGLKKKF